MSQSWPWIAPLAVVAALGGGCNALSGVGDFTVVDGPASADGAPDQSSGSSGSSGGGVDASSEAPAADGPAGHAEAGDGAGAGDVREEVPR